MGAAAPVAGQKVVAEQLRQGQHGSRAAGIARQQQQWVSKAEVATAGWRWQQRVGGGGRVAVAMAAMQRLCGNGSGSAAAGQAEPPRPLPAADSSSGQAPSANVNAQKQAAREIMLKQPNTYLTFSNILDF
jgi:hypothetical protein